MRVRIPVCVLATMLAVRIGLSAESSRRTIEIFNNATLREALFSGLLGLLTAVAVEGILYFLFARFLLYLSGNRRPRAMRFVAASLLVLGWYMLHAPITFGRDAYSYAFTGYAMGVHGVWAWWAASVVSLVRNGRDFTGIAKPMCAKVDIADRDALYDAMDKGPDS